MEIRADVPLRGESWSKAIDAFQGVFEPRTQYDLFMLSLAVGILYDQRIEKFNALENEPQKSVGRNIFVNNDNGRLDFYYQVAIISTTTENIPEDERLALAFGEKGEEQDKNPPGKRRIDFLLEFANFGVTKIVETIGSTKIESMDNLKNFLIQLVEGKKLDAPGLSLDDLTVEELELALAED